MAHAPTPQKKEATCANFYLLIYLYTPIHHRITANGTPGSHTEVSTG